MSSYLDEALSPPSKPQYPSQRQIRRYSMKSRDVPNVSGAVLGRFVQNPWGYNDRPSSKWNERDWAEFLGPDLERLRPRFVSRGLADLGQEPLSTASGARGSVFIFDASVMPALDALKVRARVNGNFVDTGAPRRGRRVVVKVTSILPDDWRRTVFEPPSWLLREAQIQAYLTTAGCKVAEDGVRYCADEVVPRLYWSGFFPKDNVQVMVMEGIDGKTLYSTLAPARREVARALYAKVEHAVFTLWAFGIVHGDLHWNNVMVSREGQVKIVDFGFALMADKLARFPTPDARTMRSAKYHKLVDTLSDDTMLHRRYPVYNPNTKSLKHLFGATQRRASEVSIPPPPVASPAPPPPPPDTDPVAVSARLLLGAARVAHTTASGTSAELVPGFRMVVTWGNGTWDLVITALPPSNTVEATRAAWAAGQVLCQIRLSGTASSRVVAPQVTSFATPQAQATGNALAAAVVDRVRASTGEPWQLSYPHPF
jgi:serine/threonine protein kinase